MIYDKPKIYFIDDREIHMVTDFLGICWNTEEDSKRERITLPDGSMQTVTTTTHVRTHGPYLDFVRLNEYSDGEMGIDEDSPVEGGFSLKYARELMDGLYAAISYMQTLQR